MNSLYDDGRHYDALFPGPDDLPFYRKQIEASGEPVLELACGTGRLTLPLALAGVDITGMDASHSMLEVARRKAAQSRATASFVEGDMSDFRLDRKFRLIFVACNSFSHLLQNEAIESCLRCVHDHLAPGGRFIVDIFTPSLRLLTRDPSQPASIGEYDHPDSGAKIVVTTTDHYDTATQVNHSTWHYTNTATQESWDVPFQLRMFFPQEIDALLRHNGFHIERKFGSFDEVPFSHGAPKQLIVCRCE